MIKSRKMKWTWHVAHIREPRNSIQIFVWKARMKRSLGIPRCSLEDNIKMDLKDIGWYVVVRKVMNLHKPMGISQPDEQL
jgi:hypothetical protein